MKTRILSLAIALIALFTFGNANAQNPHFNKNNPPCVSDAGTTLCVDGVLHGLGNYAGQGVMIQIVAEGTVYTECTNPGGNVAPGQNSTTTLSSTPALVPVGKNGRASFNICTNEPNVTTASAGCPNASWTGSAIDVVFTRAWIIVEGTRIEITDYINQPCN